MPFFNSEKFIEEAIQSVLAQTHSSWELLLVDDGSRDGSTGVALEYAGRYPGKVRYLEHEGHQNRGQAASRNLGFDFARGQYVALLDSDDAYDPRQLEEQVSLLADYPAAGMVYGSTLRWCSWAGDAADQVDWVADLGSVENQVQMPPTLVARFLRREARPPYTCSLLVRREAVERTAGSEERFRSLFDDVTFIFKVCLHFPVLAANRCWGRYRGHSQSSIAVSKAAVREVEAFLFFDWLVEYVKREGVGDKELWEIFEDGQYWLRHPFQTWLLLHAQPVGDRLASLRRSMFRKIRGQSAGEIVARPNPVFLADESAGSVTTLSWSAEGAEAVEVRVDAPDGQLFSRSLPEGSKQTGPWLVDGMVFYLQDVSSGNGLTSSDTLATVRIRTVAPEYRDHHLYRAHLQSSQRYNAQFRASGMDRYLAGDYKLRNEALAGWILESHPRRVFEFAAGGAGLARLLENEVDEYVWSDYAQVAVEAASKLLTKARVRRIDICDDREVIPWGSYDTVVCVSPGDIPDDLEVLSEVAPGSHVFLSCAASADSENERVFAAPQSVRDRFGGLLEIVRIEVVAGQILAHGVRKDRRRPDRELRRMFVSKHHHYLESQPRMHKFVARNLYGSVLEAGCRGGFLYPYLHCDKYVGLDLCREAVEAAKRRYPAEFMVSDWADPACSGHFDSIYFNNVLRCQADQAGTARKYERFGPSRIVVQELEEVRIELPYRLRSRKDFHLKAHQPERFTRRVVRVFDV